VQQREDIVRADTMAKPMHASARLGKNGYKSYKKGVPNASAVYGANNPTAISAM